MSQENRAADPGELTRRLYETADRGDFDAMVRLFRPGAVWDLSAGESEPSRARQPFATSSKAGQKSYEDYKVAVEEIVDLGKGVTLGVPVQTGRPTGSSGEVQIRFASIQICEDGLIVWMKNYNEIDQNRAAAERLAQERE